MTYEQGFSDGERQAFNDRRDGTYPAKRGVPMNAYWHGYWDAYHCRSIAWGHEPVTARKNFVRVAEFA